VRLIANLVTINKFYRNIMRSPIHTMVDINSTIKMEILEIID